MEYCNKTRKELAEDLAKLRNRIQELERTQPPELEAKGLDRHLDSFRIWQSTFDVVREIMYVIDRDFKIIRANRSAVKSLDNRELLGRKCFKLFHDRDNPTAQCPACKVFHSGRPVQIERQERDLGNRWFEVSAYPIKDDFGFVWQCLLIYRDITECKEMQAKLKELAIKDDLTGLINRRHFMEVLNREFNLAARRGSGLVLLIVNVDRFREINKFCGRRFGDFVLKEISELLMDRVRKTDICGRIGADEFGILLPDAEFREGEMIAQAIHSLVGQFVFDDGEQGRQVSISIGLAANNEDHSPQSHEELFSLADLALHEAKREGGDQVAVLRDWMTEGGDVLSAFNNGPGSGPHVLPDKGLDPPHPEAVRPGILSRKD